MNKILNAIAQYILSHKRCEHEWDKLEYNLILEKYYGRQYTHGCMWCTEAKIVTVAPNAVKVR